VAAGVAGAFFTRQYWLGDGSDPVHLTATVGEVTLKAAGGREVPFTGGPVPADAVVSTVGPSSSAVLKFADGSEVSLGGEAVAAVADRGRRLNLLRGTLTATVPAQTAGGERLSVGTTEASCSRLGGAVLTLSRTLQATTEVGVQTGRAAVADAAGEPLEVVHSGEVLTVRADGRHHKGPLEPARAEFAWDLTRPLPEGWTVGVREVTADGPVVRPVRWFDPYHKAEMYQIRSDHQWARGFARLVPDSAFRVRYRVDRPGRGQLTVIVRTDTVSQSDTGVVECNGAFDGARPGEWQWLEVKAGAMLDNPHTPKFGPPWVAFLIIVNTYQEDLGLQIAALQVVPPAPAAG
jgi:hypothetical protein